MDKFRYVDRDHVILELVNILGKDIDGRTLSVAANLVRELCESKNKKDAKKAVVAVCSLLGIKV